jgi:hypothetical protein
MSFEYHVWIMTIVTSFPCWHVNLMRQLVELYLVKHNIFDIYILALQGLTFCIWKCSTWKVLVIFCFCSVRNHQANSHSKKGWEHFTDAVIKTISQKKEGVVFLLWGNSAQEKSKYVYHASLVQCSKWIRYLLY